MNSQGAIFQRRTGETGVANRVDSRVGDCLIRPPALELSTKATIWLWTGSHLHPVPIYLYVKSNSEAEEQEQGKTILSLELGSGKRRKAEGQAVETGFDPQI